MAEVDRARIKSLYSELTGYLDTLPAPKGYNGPTRIGRRFNTICDELSPLTRNDYSHLKLNEDDDEDFNGYGFDGATLKTSISGIVSRLRSDYGFETQDQISGRAAIVINNQNTNTIDININFTIENLIESAQTEEERENLQNIAAELKKPDADWGNVKKSLNWVINYNKDLSLKVIPLVLDYYLKKGG